MIILSGTYAAWRSNHLANAAAVANQNANSTAKSTDFPQGMHLRFIQKCFSLLPPYIMYQDQTLRKIIREKYKNSRKDTFF